ncbi:MAG: SUMF1/EgtB/PvdO family nonheme iron enzyme [Cyclobacteriaceae bacterium]|nr:SUMF1/EgtB/PvdO family nonheme iron enzyme [Cyclobacteriaceae bacterium]
MKINIKSSLGFLTMLLSAVQLIAQNPIQSAPPEGMVYVPAGSFIMGSEIGDPDERPQHIAFTEAFYIDRYEVSNVEFARFDPAFKIPEGKENNAARVTWSQANAYANWAGKRLPTEKEWEKAARGTDGRMFPWGNTFDITYVIWDQSHPRGSAIAKPESPYGCIDMAGGVWEWTSNWYAPYPGNEVPMEQYGEQYKVMRGGSNFNNQSFYRTTQRYYLLPEKISRYPVGFRCVKDVR